MLNSKTYTAVVVMSFVSALFFVFTPYAHAQSGIDTTGTGIPNTSFTGIDTGGIGIPDNVVGGSNGIQSCRTQGLKIGGIASTLIQGVIGSFGGDGSSSGGQSTIDWETEFVPASTLGNSNGWTNPSNTFASDDQYATASTFLASQDYDGFEFMLPSNAAITGIEVLVEASASTAGGEVGVELSGNNTNTITTTNRSTGLLSTNDNVTVFGGPTDLWGRNWTVNELSRSNFRVRFLAEPLANTIRVDLLEVKVYYQTTETTGGSGGSSSGSGSALGGIGGNLLSNVGQQTVTGLLQGKSLDQIVKGLAGNILGGTGGTGGLSFNNIILGDLSGLSGVGGSVVPVNDARVQSRLENEVYKSLSAILREAVTQTHKECVLDPMTTKVREAVIKQMTAETLQAANTGCDGGPCFITNLPRFRKDVYNHNTGRAIEEYSNNIAPEHRQSAQQYAANELLRTPAQRLTRSNSSGCDWEAYRASNWQPGGLEVCLSEQIKNPDATSDLGTAIALRDFAHEVGAEIVETKTKELEFGDGFFSDVECPEGAMYISGACQIVTPGAVIRDQVSEAVGTPRRQVEAADEISELLSSLFNQLLGHILSGSRGFFGLTQSFGGQSSYLNQLTSSQSLTEGFNDFRNSTFSDSSPTTGNGAVSTTDITEQILYSALFYAYPERIHSGVTLLSTLPTSVDPQTIDGSLSGGLNSLTEVARTEDNEHRLLYRDISGSPSWTYLGEGGQLANISWSDINAVVQSNAQNATLAYTIPRKESCELAPPSIADLATISFARNTLLTGSNASINFVAVDSKGWWTFDVPASWTENLFNTEARDLALHLAAVNSFENNLSNVPPAADPRVHYTNVFENALNGDYGTNAQTLATQLEASLPLTPIASLVEAEEDLIQAPCTLTTQRQTLVDTYISKVGNLGVFIERTSR